jgi:hypothetical protein
VACAAILLAGNKSLLRITKKVQNWEVTLAGEEHCGWLPVDAAIPLRTADEQWLGDVRIVENVEDGYLLILQRRNEEMEHDLWFQELKDAEEAAKKCFGIEQRDWD